MNDHRPWRGRLRTAAWRALQGGVLGIGAPLGWIVIQALAGLDPLADLQARPGVYVYMLAATVIVFAGFGYYVGLHEQSFEEKAVHDELTGLANARFFWQRLREDFAAARRLHFPLSLIVLDLDRFKSVNDSHGHAAGDAVLRAVGAALTGRERKSDLVARIGGEEFAVALPFTDAVEAAELAERLRRSLAALRHAAPGAGPFAVTASFGVACAQPEGAIDSPEMLFEKADAMMYRAKQQGRDRVVVAEDD